MFIDCPAVREKKETMDLSDPQYVHYMPSKPTAISTNASKKQKINSQAQPPLDEITGPRPRRRLICYANAAEKV